MRVLYLNHNVAGSGTYQRAYHLAREMAGRGHSVTLVTTSRTRRLSAMERGSEGVRVVEAPDLLTGGARNGWDPWDTVWRNMRLRDERFDLVHAFDCRPTVILPALAQRRRTGAPLFLDWADWWGHGGTIEERSGRVVRTLFGPVETWFEEHFRTGATANTTISEPLRQRCIGLGASADRVLALPNGCSPPDPAAPERQTARRALGLSDEPLILHLGVMQPADADFLFAALANVLRSLPRARLVLVGTWRGSVPGQLASSVLRTGFVDADRLRHWLAAADVGVVPLRDTVASRARWPGKVNDYLTAGLPVALPRVGAAAEWVAGAGAGLTCTPTAAALGDALLSLLQSSDERRRLAAGARALAAGPLAWQRIADRLLEFYDNCAPQAGAPSQNGITAGVS